MTRLHRSGLGHRQAIGGFGVSLVPVKPSLGSSEALESYYCRRLRRLPLAGGCFYGLGIITGFASRPSVRFFSMKHGLF